MHGLASKLVETYLARQRYLDGEDQDAQWDNYARAYDIAEVAISVMRQHAPGLGKTKGFTLTGRGRARTSLRTPFYPTEGGIKVATRMTYTRTEQNTDLAARLDENIESYAILLDRDTDRTPYASVHNRGLNAIKYAAGDEVIHAEGYNSTADLEVISFFLTVSDGIRAAAQRSHQATWLD